ncbi:MAG: sulfite exporter TauE/SafE family protein [Coriobacteriia bacterium]|nr:sulfite exporter TauE/SafE family protein [Coriobacteriia bacterium]
MITLFVSSFALGLATSVHCLSMCGPMVVTYVVQCSDDTGWRGKLAPNLVYQGAKIFSYAAVGTLLGAIGSAFDVDAIRPWVMALAGVFMIILGLGMTGRFPWALRLTPRPPKALVNALLRLRRKATADAEQGESTLAVPAAFGLLTGLMPCAPLQAAQLVAASSGSALTGGLTMLAFGLGTAPLMLAFGTASSMIPKTWKQRLHIVLAVVVIISGLVFLNRAALLTGFPVNSRAVLGIFNGTSDEPALEFTTASDGVAEVPLVIQSVQYFPSTVVVPADRQVRLIVDRREAVGCSDRLVIPGMDVDVALAPNATTEVVLPASEPGTYPMTCGMGMMSGEIVVRAP